MNSEEQDSRRQGCSKSSLLAGSVVKVRSCSAISMQDDSNCLHPSQHIDIVLIFIFFGDSGITLLQFQAMKYLGMPDWLK